MADLWERRDWETQVTRREDGTSLVGGQRGDVRGLMLVLPDPDAEVRTARLRRFVERCERQSVGMRVVATQGRFTDEVRRVAERRRVHLVDRDRLERTVREGGFEAVVERHRGGDGGPASAGEGGSRLPALSSLPAGVRGSAASVRARVAGDPKRLLAVVVVAAVLTSGIVAGNPLNVVGGGGGTAGTAISAVSTATPDADESLVVRWNAETRSTLHPPNGTFEPPDGETFVVVRLEVTNAAGGPVMFGGPNLLFEADGVRYGSQPLNGANLATVDRFSSGDAGTAWAVFSVPANTTAGTVVVRHGLAADGPGVRFVHDPALSVEFESGASGASGESNGSGES
jgi:hypothetical protein